MSALYSHTTRATGTILTAAIYNADHENHITYGDAQYLGGWSANATQMQTVSDPGESGTESLSTSISDELERLRFAILEIKQDLDSSLSYWYQTPNPNDISARPPFPQDYITGLPITVAVTSRGTVEIGAGACRSYDNVMNLVVSSVLTRTATAQWVTAAGGGGRALAATLGNKQTYHFFVFKTAASTIDIGFDTVLTASNLMARASATHYRRVGSFHTGTGGAFGSHSQLHGYVRFHDSAADANATFTATVGNATTPFHSKLTRVPTGLNLRAKVAIGGLVGPATAIFLRIADGEATGPNLAIGPGYGPLAYKAVSGELPAHYIGEYWTNVSGELSFCVNSATANCKTQMRTLGWWDPRTA